MAIFLFWIIQDYFMTHSFSWVVVVGAVVVGHTLIYIVIHNKEAKSGVLITHLYFDEQTKSSHHHAITKNHNSQTGRRTRTDHKKQHKPRHKTRQNKTRQTKP